MERTVWGFRPTFRVKARGQGVSWGQGSCQVHTGCPSTKKWRYFCFGAAPMLTDYVVHTRHETAQLAVISVRRTGSQTKETKEGIQEIFRINQFSKSNGAINTMVPFFVCLYICQYPHRAREMSGAHIYTPISTHK